MLLAFYFSKKIAGKIGAALPVLLRRLPQSDVVGTESPTRNREMHGRLTFVPSIITRYSLILGKLLPIITRDLHITLAWVHWSNVSKVFEATIILRGLRGSNLQPFN